eukprot:PITA_26249
MSNYEREASIRPLIFDGTNFVYWNVRVTAYLKSLGTKVWDIIDTGYTFPSATPTDPAEKKKYETNAKAVNTLLRCLSQSEFLKVMQFKSPKEIWDKIVLSYEGDDQVKQAKLQTLKIQYEKLKMYNDESVANYFLRVDEIVNCMKNLGEEVKEAVVVEKVLRSLSSRFESKVSAIEEKENLQNLKMSQLHGILTAYEMRKGGPLDRRVVAFKVSSKGEYYESGHVSEEEEESNFVRNLQQARRSEQRPNRNHQVNQGQSSSRTNKDYQENRGHATLRTNRSYNQPHVKSSQFSSRMDGSRNYNWLDDSRRNFFNGQCFSCHKFGHKAAQCVAYKTIMTREAKKQRSMPAITKRTYNNFSSLENEIECSICNNFGHEDYECRSRFWKTTQKEQTSSAKTWRMREPQTKRCGIAFYAEGQENQWYIGSGCSKHMTAIKGKGIAQLKEKVKAGNVLYVDGLKHNLLTINQMCDNGTEVIFRSDGCSVRDIDIGRTVIKGRRTPNNLYIFEEGEQQCYLSKNDEHWLRHRRLGHLRFSQIRKACKYQAVHGLPDIKIPDNTI